MNTAIYIHYPFCESKCPYCDFNSHVRDQIDHQRFLKAYLRELSYFKEKLPVAKISSIFFGGGTPSLMPAEFIAKLLEHISYQWEIADDCEITLEANPSSSEADKFRAFRLAGVNRLSIGVQSLDDRQLKFLGRKHNSNSAIQTLKTASKIFDNYSFDLIYARPKQNLDEWREELTKAFQYVKGHISLYQLTIEKGTPFFKDFRDKKFFLPDDAIAADFYELTNEICAKNNLPFYEVSNYAKPGLESRHNLTYWKSGNYLGIGAGAHSRFFLKNRRIAMMNKHNPETWCKSIETKSHALQNITRLTSLELFDEVILMGLRTKFGVDNNFVKNIFGKGIEKLINQNSLKILQEENLINFDGDILKVTEQGILNLNGITSKLLS